MEAARSITQTMVEHLPQPVMGKVVLFGCRIKSCLAAAAVVVAALTTRVITEPLVAVVTVGLELVGALRLATAAVLTTHGNSVAMEVFWAAAAALHHMDALGMAALPEAAADVGTTGTQIQKRTT